MSQPALFSASDSERKASVLDKLHVHSYHVFVWQESKQLAHEAMVSGCVINCSQIYKHGTKPFFCLKHVLNIMG